MRAMCTVTNVAIIRRIILAGQKSTRKITELPIDIQIMPMDKHLIFNGIAL